MVMNALIMLIVCIITVSCTLGYILFSKTNKSESNVFVGLSNTNRYYRIVIGRTDDGEISVDDFSSAITVDFSGCSFYLVQNTVEGAIERLRDHIKTNKANIESNRIEIGIVKSATLETKNLFIENGSINYSGQESDSVTRLRTSFFEITNTLTITINSGYKARLFIYNQNFTLKSAPGEWSTGSITISDTVNYYRIIIGRTNDAEIRIDEITNAITANFAGCKFYLIQNTVEKQITDILEKKCYEQFNLNRNLIGLSDMVWEYQNWVFPQVISYSRIRDRLYFTFTNEAGYSGIAQYDYNTHNITKNFLKKNTETDDHNLIAVMMMSNHHLICAYSGGHNTDNNIYVRIADAEESIESFGEAVVLKSTESTTYSQIFEYDEKLYLFYRTGNTGWSYRISSDYGKTWTSETKLVQSTVQYYIQLTETTTDGVLRMCCYSNPAENDMNIRMGYLHLDTMTLYDTDNATTIGTSSITPSQITAVIPVTTGKMNRLFNAAKTAIGDTKILYCVFSDVGDGEYFVYDNGDAVKVADAGIALWAPKAQLGIAWIGTSQIAVARGSQGRDLIEIYDYSNKTVTFNKTVADNARGTLGIRTARPMIDDHQRTMVYLKGYFNQSSFKDFAMDGNIYDLIT
jgi:hypothetical protein